MDSRQQCHDRPARLPGTAGQKISLPATEELARPVAQYVAQAGVDVRQPALSVRCADAFLRPLDHGSVTGLTVGQRLLRLTLAYEGRCIRAQRLGKLQLLLAGLHVAAPAEYERSTGTIRPGQRHVSGQAGALALRDPHPRLPEIAVRIPKIDNDRLTGVDGASNGTRAGH